jgi:hypothetical protein
MSIDVQASHSRVSMSAHTLRPDDVRRYSEDLNQRIRWARNHLASLLAENRRLEESVQRGSDPDMVLEDSVLLRRRERDFDSQNT